MFLERHIYNIFFLFVFLFCTIAEAQTAIELTENKPVLRIGKNVSFLKDPSQSLTFQQVLSPEFQQQFEVFMQDAPNFGNVQMAVWNKFSVINRSSKKWLLTVESYNIDTLSFYYPDSTGIYHEIKSGRSRPFSSRKYKTSMFTFDLDVKGNDTATFYLKVETFFMQYPLVVLTEEKFIARNHKKDFYAGLYFGFLTLIVLYNLFIFFTVKEKNFLYYIVYVVLNGLLVAEIKGVVAEIYGDTFHFMYQYSPAIIALSSIMAVVFTVHFLETKTYVPVIHKIFKYLFLPVFIFIIILSLCKYNLAASILNQVAGIAVLLIMYAAAILAYRKGYLAARFYITACVFYFIGVVIYVAKAFNLLPFTAFTDNAIEIGSAFEMMMFSFGLADKINVYKKEKEKAQKELLATSQEKEKLITEQNKMLETKVKERTSALENTLSDLKNTQQQLIQSEKLASLGQLSAGIAHEIKNPLNFVNNFSEISMGLIDELNGSMTDDDRRQTMEDLKMNISRVNHHGNRASWIVKSMLDHVHIGKADQVMTNINRLIEEYVTLSYQGVRANTSDFFCAINKNFDINAGEIPVIPGEIGRVVLNITQNAFYALMQKQKSSNKKFDPGIFVSTLKHGDTVEIKIKDNGTGIPQDILTKIFDPFYTTKPTGDGTGLGLSLSYDIVNAHKGTLSVNSKEGEFTEFVITLPRN